MKEQWKKLDNDAKLLVDVEEGRQLPIKINIPLAALTPQRDEFCCNRFLTILRVFVLLGLLVLIGWTGMSFYNTYYAKTIPEQSNLENSFSFQSQVYQKKDDVETTAELKKSDSENDEFRDSTKKALELIAAQMKGFNERLDHMQDKKEQQTIVLGDDKTSYRVFGASENSDHMQDEKELQKTVLVDAKSIDRDFGGSESSDPTLDSMFDELAEKVGLANTQKSDDVLIEYKPEYNAIVLTEPVLETKIDKQDKSTEGEEADIWARLVEMALEQERHSNIDEIHESDYLLPSKPVELANVFPSVKSNEDIELDEMIRTSIAEREQLQKEYSEMWDRFATNIANIDESHEEDKQVDQVIQSMIDRIAESGNLENDNDSEQKESEDNTEAEPTEESNEGIGEKIVREMIVEPFEYLFGDPADEVSKEDGLSGSSIVEESNVEDEIEKETQEETRQDSEDDLLTQVVKETIGEFLTLGVVEDETEKENDEKNEGGTVDYFEGFLDLPKVEYDDMQHKLPAMSSEKFLETKEVAPIQERKSLIEMVPDVEYVKKIQANPVIPRLAKMVEPMVGQNQELLIWYYTHKDLPEFVKGADKWKVFCAKLLYDSNIKDYPADATIVSGLAFEKVLGVAEYPASNEEIQSDLQQEIVNRLILKSYLNKMLLEGNAEAETLSRVIEQHNEEKLKQLDINPQELSYRGDPYEVSNTDDLEIPVVQFDPFVDDSVEANEQRTQVLKAFKKTYSQDFFDTISYKALGQKSEDSTTTAPLEISEVSEAVGQSTKEQTVEETTLGTSEEELPSTTEESKEVDMNAYLFSYDDPYDW